MAWEVTFATTMQTWRLRQQRIGGIVVEIPQRETFSVWHNCDWWFQAVPPPRKKYAHGEPPSQKKKKLGRISSFLALGSTKNWASHISASHQDLFPPLSRTKVPSSTHQAAHIHWWHILYLRLKTNLRDLKLKLCAERVRKSSYIAGLCQTHAFQLPGLSCRCFISDWPRPLEIERSNHESAADSLIRDKNELHLKTS